MPVLFKKNQSAVIAVDALKLGFSVILILSLCRGIAEDTQRSALKEMESEGVKIIGDMDSLF